MISTLGYIQSKLEIVPSYRASARSIIARSVSSIGPGTAGQYGDLRDRGSGGVRFNGDHHRLTVY